MAYSNLKLVFIICRHSLTKAWLNKIHIPFMYLFFFLCILNENLKASFKEPDVRKPDYSEMALEQALSGDGIRAGS